MRWIINDDILSLELQNGNMVVPSAKQIYLAEFKGECVIDGAKVIKRPSQDLPHISFSKYPLDVSLVVTPPKAGLSRSAECKIQGIRGKTRINIDNLFEEMPDHILAGNNCLFSINIMRR